VTNEKLDVCMCLYPDLESNHVEKVRFYVLTKSKERLFQSMYIPEEYAPFSLFALTKELQMEQFPIRSKLR
jgi:hypothetical protein